MKSKAPGPMSCNCLSLRQAARHVSQFYDQRLAPYGLTLNQYALLGRLATLGPTPINEVAQELVVDRTTLTRNVRPLQQAGLIAQAPHPADGRSQCLSLTKPGRELLAQATPAWATAQVQFEQAFGMEQAAALRQMLQAVTKVSFSG